MKVPYFIPWINKKDKDSIQAVLNQRWLTTGPQLKKFEKKFSSYVGTKFASGVGNASQALHLAVRSLDIGPNDEVIVPTFTFAATANAVLHCGAKPILADVDYEFFNILPGEIKKKINKNTRAIIVVHYGGQSCDMKEILSISKKFGLKVIEDCAHALGSTYNYKKCGSIGISGCYSFYPTKIITSGEGGMVTTNSLKIYHKINSLKSHGMNILSSERELKAKWAYDINELGYNYRLDEIRSSLGLSQLQRVREINLRRIKLAKKYDKKLNKIKGIVIPKTKEDRNHIYHLYTIKIQKEYNLSRNELFKKLHHDGIGTSVQYIPLHMMSYMKNQYKQKKSMFKNANKLKDEVISLPIFPTMTNKQLDLVVSKIKQYS